MIAGRTAGGNRDYLEDEPISAGGGIDFYDDGIWIPGRDEANFRRGEGYFVYDDAGEERWLVIDCE